jgi:hypothetical protein
MNLTIQRAFDCQTAALKDMGVDHGGFYVFVPEQFLNGADVVLQQFERRRIPGQWIMLLTTLFPLVAF